MKKKNKLTKSIIGLAMGGIIALGALPAVNLSTIFKANADESLKSVYTETEVSVKNFGFEEVVNGTTTPDSWDADYISADEGKNEKDSTTMSGSLNIDYEDYNTSFNQHKTNELSTWNGNHLSDANNQLIYDYLAQLLTPPTNPLTHNITDNTASNKSILYIDAGKTYTNFVVETNGDDNSENDYVSNVDVANRQVYYTYTSNNFTLDAYSYYRISVWVKTNDGGKASIALGKDFEDEYFTNIQAEETLPNLSLYKKVTSGVTTYFYKDNSDETRPIVDQNYVEGEKTYTYDQLTGTWSNDQTSISLLESNLSNSAWTKYSIYVSTGYNSSNAGKYTTNLVLGLGSNDQKSSGIVFFDDAKVEKIQYSTFLTALSEDKESNGDTKEDNAIAIADFRKIDQRNNNENDYFEISSFNSINQLSESGWEIDARDGGTTGTEVSIENEQETTKIYSTFGNSSNSILKVENYGEKALGLTSVKTTIEPFNYYRVSLWSRSDYSYNNASSQSFTIYLNATLNSKTVKTKELTVKPYDSQSEKDKPSSINNYWTETVILVESCPIYSTDVWVTLSIPKETSFMFDNFVIEKISSTEYKDSDKTKLSLTTSLPTETITNGHFNLIETKSNEANPLYQASGWTKTITTKADVYKYFDDLSDSTYTSIINNEEFTVNDDSIIYNGKTFTKVADDNTTFAYKPYRYKLTKYSPTNSQYGEVENIYLPEEINTNTTFTYEDREYIYNISEDAFVYTEPGTGNIFKITSNNTIREATEKIVVAKDVTFSFDEEKDAFTSELYTNFKLNEKSIENKKFFHGIINGYNYNNTIQNGIESITLTENATFINPNNVYENYLTISNVKSIVSDEKTINNFKTTYKSDKISVAASSHKLISLYTYLDTNFDGEVTINLLNVSNQILATQKISKKDVLTPGENNWQTVSFYLKNGVTATTVYLEIIYGSSESTTTGTALFKTATVKSSTSSIFTNLATEKTVDERKAEYIMLVELGGESFVELGESLGDGYYESLTIKKTDDSTGSLSILDTSVDKEALADYIYEKAKTPYVLVIKNANGNSTKIKPYQAYSLSASSYYKFEVVAKTLNLEDDKYATISFTNLNETLSVTSDEFKTYTLLVATTSKAVTAEFAVELINASGEVVIDSLTFTKIDESSYKSAVGAIADKDITKAVDLRETSNKSDDEEPIEEESKTLEILFATLSSLLLVVAIIFALV
ncbi:MAG: hypothetical protein J6J23_07360, partial [Clostridia bacterium]|nr:hypothetical protein [Clostridia bacterium]